MWSGKIEISLGGTGTPSVILLRDSRQIATRSYVFNIISSIFLLGEGNLTRKAHIM